jgi:hypothetical protein
VFRALEGSAIALIHDLQVSLDNLNEEANERYSKAFFQYFQEKLGIQGDRGYMYEVRYPTPLITDGSLYPVNSQIPTGHSLGTYSEQSEEDVELNNAFSHKGVTFASIFRK